MMVSAIVQIALSVPVLRAICDSHIPDILQCLKQLQQAHLQELPETAYWEEQFKMSDAQRQLLELEFFSWMCKLNY